MRQELGFGFGAKVYAEVWRGQQVAKKIFDPHIIARLAYRGLRFREHPYQAEYNEAVVGAAFELRRVAHRVSRAFGGGAEVVDALDLCHDEVGFLSPFIRGLPYQPKDSLVTDRLNVLETRFNQIGLPVWSFGGFMKEYKRQGNVIIEKDGNVRIVDYEAGMPFFSREGIMGFDDVAVLRFERFLHLGKQTLQFRLGDKEYEYLQSSWERYKAYSLLWRDGLEKAPIRKAQILRDALSWRSLQERIKQLREAGNISSERADRYSAAVQANRNLLERIAPHMLVHFFTTGLPAGGIILRPLYTATMRAVSEVRAKISPTARNADKIQIHNLTVALLSAISLSIPGVPFASLPLPGYLAYVVNVGKAPLGFLVLDNLVYRISGVGLGEFARHIGRGKFKQIMNIAGRLSETTTGKRLGVGARQIAGKLLSDEAIEEIITGLARGAFD